MEENKIDDTPQYDALMQTLNLIATIPSLIGTMLMIYYCFRGLAGNISTKFIFALAISDFIFSVTNLMTLFGYPQESACCKAEGVLRAFSSKFSISIVVSIAILHYQIMRADPSFNKIRFLAISIVGGGLICLVFALSPIFVGNIADFHKAGIMCAIGSASQDNTLRIIGFLIYKPLFPVSAVIITLVYYVRTIRIMKNIQASLNLSEKLNSEKLLWYPLTIFVIFMPSQFYYFLSFCFRLEDSRFWEGATLLITHSLGLVNALVYGYQRRVYKKSRHFSETSNIEFRNESERDVSFNQKIISSYNT